MQFHEPVMVSLKMGGINKYMKNIFNLNSTSTGLNAFSRASKGDSQDARKGSTLTKMAAVICTFSSFQGG